MAPPDGPETSCKVTEEKSLVTIFPALSSTATTGWGVTGENADPPVGCCCHTNWNGLPLPLGASGAPGSEITVVTVWGGKLFVVEEMVSVYCWAAFGMHGVACHPDPV